MKIENISILKRMSWSRRLEFLRSAGACRGLAQRSRDGRRMWPWTRRRRRISGWCLRLGSRFGGTTRARTRRGYLPTSGSFVLFGSRTMLTVKSCFCTKTWNFSLGVWDWCYALLPYLKNVLKEASLNKLVLLFQNHSTFETH